MAEGYYTSKYSGEEIDALLDKIVALEAAVVNLTNRIAESEGGGT